MTLPCRVVVAAMRAGHGGATPAMPQPCALIIVQRTASWHPPLWLTATPFHRCPQPEVLLSPDGCTGTSPGGRGLGAGSTAAGGEEAGAAGELESPLPGMPIRV